MVSRAHRFLHGRELSTVEPVWRLTANTDDIFFHDAYLGCLPLAATIRHWAREQDPDVVAVTLTARGDLGPDDDAAALLDLLRPGRRPARGCDPGAAQTARPTAEGRGYLDQLTRLAAAFGDPNGRSIVAVVEGLPEQCEEAAPATLRELQRTMRILVRCARTSTGLLLVLLDPRDELEAFALWNSPVTAIGLPAPRPEEIGAALTRVSLRHDLAIRHTASIAAHLAAGTDLHGALRRAASAARDSRIITADALLGLPEPDEDRVDAVFRDLDSLIGLEAVKAHMHGLPALARRRRADLRERGTIPQATMHMVFKGAAGTGKTSVARIVARLFHALGLLPTDKVVEIPLGEVIAEHVGGTGARMLARLGEGAGGVVLVDEAHHLTRNQRSREAIDPLLVFAEDHRSNTVIILAGYSDQIDRLMRADPGLPRRFPTVLTFPDYTAEELGRVVRKMARDDGFTIDRDAEAPLARLLADRCLDAGFGNAGGARNTWQEIRRAHDSGPRAAPGVIRAEDVPAVISTDDAMAAAALEALGRYTGLDALRRYLETQRDYLAHCLRTNRPRPAADGLRFVGPPGTGKTSIATTVIAPYLCGVGLLDRPTVTAATGANLQAGHSGQTPEKIRALFRTARGGVLLIDEAYSVPVEHGYGAEVIDTLVAEAARPVNRRTLVVLAGYKAEMDGFLTRNPGLRNRFPREIVFEPLSTAELLAVMRGRAQAEGYGLAADFEQRFVSIAPIARRVAGPGFGNARWAVGVYQQAKEAMISRTRARPDDDAARLTGEDLLAAVHDADPRLARLLDPAAPSRPDASPPPPSGAMGASECEGRLRDAVLPLVVDQEEVQAMGTGFLVVDSGLVATAAHVLQDATRVTAHIGPEQISAGVVAVDEETDTALLRVPAQAVAGRRPLPLGSSRDVPVSSELWAAGYHHWQPGEDPHIVQVRVSRNMRSKKVFDVAGPVEHGASGGPLIDPSQGAAVGLVRGGMGSTVKVMVRIEQVRSLLERSGRDREGTGEPEPAGAEEADSSW